MADNAYNTKLGQVVTYGSVCLNLSLAADTGVIKVLCAASGPLTSTEIAQQANSKERFVREVLGSLTSAGLVELEAGTGGSDGQEARYFVPEEHRKALAETSHPAQLVGAVSAQYEKIKDCFSLQRPSYVEHQKPLFDALDAMSKGGLERVVKLLLENTPDLRQNLENGIDVMEIGCGSALLSRRLATIFPRSQFTASDFRPEIVDLARQAAEAEGISNMLFRGVDICAVPENPEKQYDWVFSHDVIHDLPFPKKGLEGVYRLLKAKGVYSLMDVALSSYLANNIGNDAAAFIYGMSTFICVPGSYQHPDSEALGACWGEEVARGLVKNAGFELLRVDRARDNSESAVFTCIKP